MCEEAKRAEAIVEGDDHRALGRQVLAVVPRKAAGAAGEAAAVDPDHHGTTVIDVVGARPNVCIETVFAAGRLTRRSSLWRRSRCRSGRASAATAARCGSSCDTRRAERICFAHAFPLRSRLRRPPSVLAKWRRCEGNALKYADARLACADRPCEKTRVDPHLFRNHCVDIRGGRDKRNGAEETLNSFYVVC